MNYDGPYRIEERTCGVPRGGGLWPGSYRHWWVVVNARGGAESPVRRERHDRSGT